MHRPSIRSLPISIAVLVTLSGLPGQGWSPLHEMPAGRYSPPVFGPRGAFDPQRGRPLITTRSLAPRPLFGGPRRALWEWSGQRWQRREDYASPPFVTMAIVTDTTRNRVLAFGSPNSGSSGAYAYDGVRWDRLTGIIPFATGAVLAFDAARDEVVACGGERIGESSLETWTWSNGTWTQHVPAGAWPTARRDTALAFDPVRNRVVLFGGFDGTTIQPLGDCWEWDGTSWLQYTGATPSPRGGAGMAYDPGTQTLVLFGGADTSGATLDETWQFDGQLFTQASPAARPTPRMDPVVMTTPNGVLLYGGRFAGDTWLFSKGDWVELQPNPNPPVRMRAAFAFDPIRSELVLQGGVNLGSPTLPTGTWTWNGTWHRRQPANAPPWLSGADMVFDRQRGEMVLFGGNAGATGTETWTWNGHDWTVHTSATSPPWRSDPGMAYDRLRQRVVLFGGHDANFTALADTWLWDGANWTQATPTTSPPARFGPLMAYDAARGVTVMTAGYDPNSGLSDTWLWDGTDWIPTAATTVPQNTHEAEFDGRVGRVTALSREDAWSWDGSDWVHTTISGSIPPYTSLGAALAYDERRGRLVQFGGNEGVDWLLAYTPFRAHHFTFRNGCAPTGNPPELFAVGVPALRQHDFALGVRADAPGRAVVLAVGLAPARIAVGGGCEVLIDQIALTTLLQSGANGFVDSPLPIPDLPVLRGLSLYSQAFVVMPGGLAVTTSLILTIGD